MTTILILGAGIMQIPGIKLARRKGWKVIVADGNPDAAGKSLCDHFEVMDLKDKDGLLSLARACSGRFGLDGVFTAGTDFSSSVAWVAERMGLPGISYATSMRATDKCLMREAFQGAGVPSPRFTCWRGEGDPVSTLSGLGFPLVVKPVDNMGARGVRRVDSDAELVEACRAALPLSRSSRVIIEQYMTGPELSLDAVVYRGKVTVCGVADRHISFPPSFVEIGHTMPTDLPESTVRRIEGVFAAGIKAIGIDNGAAKGDIKLTPDGPMVGEIAARLSGGYMSGWTFPLSSGVEVTEAAMNIAVGLPPGDLTPRLRRVVAERALISIPGRVSRIEGESEARGCPGIAEVFLRAGKGDDVVFPTNNVQKCGNVIAVAESRSAAIAAAGAALARIRIHLEPLREETTRFLLSGKGNDAFPDLDARLTRLLDEMPPFEGKPASRDSRGAHPDLRAARARWGFSQGLARPFLCGRCPDGSRWGGSPRQRRTLRRGVHPGRAVLARASARQRAGRPLSARLRRVGQPRWLPRRGAEQAMRIRRLVPGLLLLLVFAAGAWTQERDLLSIVGDLGAVLEWDPLGDRGVISLGDDRISLGVGLPMALINYRLKVAIEAAGAPGRLRVAERGCRLHHQRRPSARSARARCRAPPRGRDPHRSRTRWRGPRGNGRVRRWEKERPDPREGRGAEGGPGALPHAPGILPGQGDPPHPLG